MNTIQNCCSFSSMPNLPPERVGPPTTRTEPFANQAPLEIGKTSGAPAVGMYSVTPDVALEKPVPASFIEHHLKPKTLLEGPSGFRDALKKGLCFQKYLNQFEFALVQQYFDVISRGIRSAHGPKEVAIMNQLCNLSEKAISHVCPHEKLSPQEREHLLRFLTEFKSRLQAKPQSGAGELGESMAPYVT